MHVGRHIVIGHAVATAAVTQLVDDRALVAVAVGAFDALTVDEVAPLDGRGAGALVTIVVARSGLLAPPIDDDESHNKHRDGEPGDRKKTASLREHAARLSRTP